MGRPHSGATLAKVEGSHDPVALPGGPTKAPSQPMMNPMFAITGELSGVRYREDHPAFR